MNEILTMILIGLVLGCSAGFVMHRSDFCIAGMFRDVFLFGRIEKIRSLVLLVVASLIGFEIARRVGLLGYYPFPLLGTPSLSNIIGGLFFGIGMTLAGGCVVGTLYKMGAGSSISLIAFLGLVTGSGLYAEIHPVWSSFIKATTFSETSKTIPQLLGLQPGIPVIMFGVIGFFLFYQWFRKGMMHQTSHATGYIQPWKAALVLALLGLISYILIGMPLGITTAYAKMAAYIENLLFEDHVAALAYFNAVPLKYNAPINNLYLEGGAGPVFDAISIIQFPVIGGIVLGSALSAILLGEFSLNFQVPRLQLLSAFIGGIIMALASRMAPACNVWHLMGGLPILAVQSVLFVIGIVPGSWIGSKILVRYVMQTGKTNCSG